MGSRGVNVCATISDRNGTVRACAAVMEGCQLSVNSTGQ